MAHVVWTGLPLKFNGAEITPSAEQVVEYLEKLTGEQREKAERYVRVAPRQIEIPSTDVALNRRSTGMPRAVIRSHSP